MAQLVHVTIHTSTVSDRDLLQDQLMQMPEARFSGVVAEKAFVILFFMNNARDSARLQAMLENELRVLTVKLVTLQRIRQKSTRQAQRR